MYNSEKYKEYYYKNLDKMKLKHKKRYARESENLKNYQRKYRENNKEKISVNNKEYRISNREKINEYNKEYYKEYFKTERGKEVRRKSGFNQRTLNSLKVKARKKLNYEVMCGRIMKKPCNVCGENKVEAHHSNYSRPLDVIWLCHRCHRTEEGRIFIK